MRLQNMPIRQKLMTVILMVSGAVLLLTCVVFVVCEIMVLRKSMVEEYTTHAEIIADNSTAALAFQDKKDATSILDALKTDPRVVRACIYDHTGKIFAEYPTHASQNLFPAKPGKSGYQKGSLEIFYPIFQGGQWLGAVYVQANLSALTSRLRAYGCLSVGVILCSVLLAYLLSGMLQNQISQPILNLAQTARAISNHGDFSVRAHKMGEDELGLLTDAFNQMLGKIQEQDQDLKASEANYREIFDKAHDAIIVLDSDEDLLSPVLDINHSAVQMMGYELEAFQGTSLKKLVSGEPGYTVEDFRRWSHKAMNEGPQLFEWQLCHKDGHRFWVEVSLQKTVLAGNTRLMAFVRDISDRKKLEETIRSENFITSIIEHIPNMVFVKDASDLRFVMFNKAGEELLGIPRFELIGKTDYDFFPKNEADQFVAKDRETLLKGKILDIPEETIQTRDKGQRIVHTKKFPVVDDTGKPRYLIGISEDITEQKKQEDLRIYAKALETSNRGLQDFIFVASHDLQEPLRKIQSFGNFLKEEMQSVLTPAGAGYLSRIQDAARRMSALIEDLLQLTRVTTRAKPFELVDISDIIQDVQSDLEIRLKESGGIIEAGKLPQWEADPTQMRQLFQNLISNSLKYHKPGVAPLIKIEGEIDTQRAKGIVRVKDNGIGFEPKYSEKIFNIFQRLHGNNEYEGTGIGLAICRKVVERHGGTITAKSRLGEGAEFEVVIPLHQTS